MTETRLLHRLQKPGRVEPMQDSLFTTPTPKPSDWKTVPLSTVMETFNYWRETHGKNRAILTNERHRTIAKALLNYPLDTVKQAIDGCALSAWHMGKNPNNKKYNDISLILRNAEKIEGFAELTDSNAGGFLDD